MRIIKFMALIASATAAANATSSNKQMKISSELDPSGTRISGPHLLKKVTTTPPHFVHSSQQTIYEALKKETDDAPPSITLKNITQLNYELQQCGVKTIEETSSDYDPNTKKDKSNQRSVRYEDAGEKLLNFVEQVSREVVPANLGQFIGIQEDDMGFTLLHQLFENLESTQRGQTFTVETALSIVRSLAPLMIANNISIHTPDKLGITPLEKLTNHVLDVNLPLSFRTFPLRFKSALPIYKLMIELTPKNDPYFKIAIGNVFVESIRKQEREQELMNFIKEVILEFGLDVNYQSPRREGPTRALEKAIRSGCDETVVGMLLDMGADPTLRDHSGHTPMDYVNKGSRKDEILRSAELLHTRQ